ncbi:MAG: tetratricopeptide repeat protein [Bacillota bacterium]|nr:tetratricopeptide repeat protein [Bacillota bacterium]
MDKSSKLYKKAVESYNDGYMDKALRLCENSISLSLNNSAVLNLKGLLLYLKGELEEAKGLWKLNKDHNRDEVSRKYLQNLAEDEERLQIYKEAVKCIGTMEFKDALVLLKECISSDFNTVNVNNALTTVYIHLGSFDQAKACIDKALSIDKLDKTARENKKLLVQYKVIEKQSRRRLVLILVLVAFLAGGSWYILRKVNIGAERPKVSFKDSVTAESGNIPSDNKSEDKSVETDSLNNNMGQNEGFPKDDADAAIEKKDYVYLSGLIERFKQDNLKTSERDTYYRGERELKDGGVAFFYNTARSLHAARRYEEAVHNYEEVMRYAGQSYLYSNAVFMLGSCYESMGDFSMAEEYFKQYLDAGYDGIYKNDYNSTILYSLLMMYKDRDPGKAKGYAAEIRNNYNGSIYNNSVVDSILKDK